MMSRRALLLAVLAFCGTVGGWLLAHEAMWRRGKISTDRN
jgi:hypothetical protein